jgi:hypothetical protein
VTWVWSPLWSLQVRNASRNAAKLAALPQWEPLEFLQLETEAVVRALLRFRETRWNEIRTLDDLDRLITRFPEDHAGSTALAQCL